MIYSLILGNHSYTWMKMGVGLNNKLPIFYFISECDFISRLISTLISIQDASEGIVNLAGESKWKACCRDSQICTVLCDWELKFEHNRPDWIGEFKLSDLSVN